MPIRLRLTLLYGLLLGATLLLFCVTLYLALQAALERNFDQTLRVRAAQVERELVNRHDDSEELQAQEISPQELESDALDDFAEPGVYVQVLSRQGEILATTGTLLPVRDTLLEQAVDLQTPEAFDTLTVGGGQRLRTLYWPIRTQNQVLAVVQVAETLQLLEETMYDARTLMLSGAAALLVAALGSGWFLTRRVLAPVAAVTEAARHIAETGRFDRRLSTTAPRDELGALAATFNVMIGRVERMVTQQREFVADTSHELRNPLSIIRGNLDFARRIAEDQACLEALHEAEIEASRMSRLVNDLLLLAQADAGQFLALTPVRLDQVADELIEQARTLADDQIIQARQPAEVWVQGDPDRLRQMLWNLVENAVRYTPSGGRIDLSVRLQGDQAVLQVSDTGPGVPPGHEERIFERFYRADPSRARATGGAGLGLAIVKHIAEAHRGRVTIENRPGEGVSFIISLPSIQPPRQSNAMAPPGTARSPLGA